VSFNSFILKHLLTSSLAFSCLLMTLITIALLSTIYDLKTHNSKNKNKLLCVFSIYANTSKLFCLNENEPESTIKCFHGLRVMSLLSVMLLHSNSYRVFYPSFNPDWEFGFYPRTLSGLSTAVNTFFVMSGCLIARSLAMKFKDNKFDIIQTYFQRFMRITPALAVVLLIKLASVYYSKANAPYLFIDSTHQCEKYWWSTLLHLQVYTNPHEIVTNLNLFTY